MHTSRKFVFGHDELLPISKTSGDDLGRWGALIVDAMLVMGLDDLFNEADNFSSRIDFNMILAGGTISVFEITIWFVGGLLSSYELSGEKHPILVTKANQVADNMDNNIAAVSLVFFFLASRPADLIPKTNTTEAGTLSLEWFTLSRFTGNVTYTRCVADLTAKSVEHIANLMWGSRSNSYFEYLLKYARLTNTNNNIFIDTWKMDFLNALPISTSTVGNHIYLTDLDDQGLICHVGSYVLLSQFVHLACFHAGNWLLGRKLLNNQTIISIALELNDGCWATLALMKQYFSTGIGPECFAFISSDGNFTGNTITANEIAFYNKHGFYITASDYIQCPEEAAITSFNKFLPSPNGVGFTCLNDVKNPAAGFNDVTESFWYLTFDDPEHISLDNCVLSFL
ncbi:seven-hairpin glycosidase [Mycena albidolilacea]|uniref:alpha-1,2-Mannosidase n=1 Tax=Mycena albidolilacea TaxID=1033008 RepID=A0AAD7ASY2_9AGAR|nr:seven-hairpin glycosidase [Mycena albidolilacea]